MTPNRAARRSERPACRRRPRHPARRSRLCREPIPLALARGSIQVRPIQRTALVGREAPIGRPCGAAGIRAAAAGSARVRAAVARAGRTTRRPVTAVQRATVGAVDPGRSIGPAPGVPTALAWATGAEPGALGARRIVAIGIAARAPRWSVRSARSDAAAGSRAARTRRAPSAGSGTRETWPAGTRAAGSRTAGTRAVRASAERPRSWRALVGVERSVRAAWTVGHRPPPVGRAAAARSGAAGSWTTGSWARRSDAVTWRTRAPARAAQRRVIRATQPERRSTTLRVIRRRGAIEDGPTRADGATRTPRPTRTGRAARTRGASGARRPAGGPIVRTIGSRSA
jgi:hypothetical protein